MNISRVVIYFVMSSLFAISVFGQQGSVASPATTSSPTKNASSMPAPKPRPKADDSSFTVLVFNFRQVSSDILSNAEKEASQIFGHAGIKVAWQECPTGNEPCRRGPGPVFFLAIKAGPAENQFLDVV